MTKMVSLDVFFDISRGVRLKKANRIAGKLPLVTAGYLNEGIAQYISNSQKTFQQAITIDMFGQIFWRPYEFAADDNIVILQKDFLTSDTAFFFLEAIKKTTGFFNYSHQYRLKNLKKHYIELPLLNGKIDWNKIKFISSVLGKITQLNTEINTELTDRKKQCYYYRNRLLTTKGKLEPLKNFILIDKGQQLNKSLLAKDGKYPVYNGGMKPSGYWHEKKILKETQ